jgi:hypothetical protein
VVGDRLGKIRGRWCNLRDRISDVRHRFWLGSAQTVVAEHGEVMSRVWVAALMCARERLLGSGQLVVVDQEPCKLEGAVGVTTLIGPHVRGRGTIDLTPLLQQYAELRGGAGVTALIRAHQRSFGLAQTVLGKEKRRELECGVGYAALVSPAVRGLSGVDVAAIDEQHT